MRAIDVNFETQRHFPEQNLRVRLRKVQTERDLNLIYDWLQKEHVREYWDMGEDLEAVRTYLDSKLDSGYLTPLIIYINDQVAGYTELYNYNLDPLARFYPGEKQDLGWHIFLGEERFIGGGFAIFVGRTIIEILFADENCRRILCEPDRRNLRMIQFVKKLSHRPLDEVVLPDKTALFMECRREIYFQENNNER